MYAVNLIICIITVCLSIYVFLYTRYGENAKAEYERDAIGLYNSAYASLINGSGINNIPRIRLETTNPEVARANSCDNGPLYIGDGNARDSDCVRMCVNDNAKAVNVGEGETVIFGSNVLRKGSHCVIGERPRCNLRTSIALMTINSVTCRSKFPRLVGGRLGTAVVACNDDRIYDPQNVLWDMARNERFDPLTANLTDEDERLPDGSYRFVCRYNGTDDRDNRYIEHPRDRLHPFQNYCAESIYRAHEDVKTLWSKDGKSYTCDCGDRRVTRVAPLNPNDPTSQCSNVFSSVTADVGHREILSVPYRCFTLYSTLSDVGRLMPCPNDQFVREGSQTSSVELRVTGNERALIEHPLYGDFGVGGASVRDNWVIY